MFELLKFSDVHDGSRLFIALILTWLSCAWCLPVTSQPHDNSFTLDTPYDTSSWSLDIAGVTTASEFWCRHSTGSEASQTIDGAVINNIRDKASEISRLTEDFNEVLVVEIGLPHEYLNTLVPSALSQIGLIAEDLEPTTPSVEASDDLDLVRISDMLVNKSRAIAVVSQCLSEFKSSLTSTGNEVAREIEVLLCTLEEIGSVVPKSDSDLGEIRQNIDAIKNHPNENVQNIAQYAISTHIKDIMTELNEELAEY